MFKCESCHNPIGRHQKIHTIVTDTRPKVYIYAARNNDKEVWKYGNYQTSDVARMQILESKGLEIVKEIKVCGDCAMVEKPWGAYHNALQAG
jgi:hypothetical protein